MLGLVFTFEDEPEQSRLAQQHPTAKRVRDAVSLAVNFVYGISFEEITDETNPKPKMAIIFDDVGLIDAFTARLTLALLPTKMRVNSVKAINQKASSEEDISA